MAPPRLFEVGFVSGGLGKGRGKEKMIYSRGQAKGVLLAV